MEDTSENNISSSKHTIPFIDNLVMSYLLWWFMYDHFVCPYHVDLLSMFIWSSLLMLITRHVAFDHYIVFPLPPFHHVGNIKSPGILLELVYHINVSKSEIASSLGRYCVYFI